MILQTGIGLSAAAWALVRTWSNPRRTPTTDILDVVVVVVLVVAILKGIFA